jgi:hypothetical protein
MIIDTAMPMERADMDEQAETLRLCLLEQDEAAYEAANQSYFREHGFEREARLSQLAARRSHQAAWSLLSFIIGAGAEQ